MGIPVLVIDEGKVSAANAAATRLLGECTGMACHEAVRGRDLRGAVCMAGCAVRRPGAGPKDTGRVRVRGHWWRLVCDRVGNHTIVQMLQAVDDVGEQLTPREREILDWIAKGCTTRDVARKLGIQPSTVRTHVERLLDKLGARTRAEAIARVRAAQAASGG